MKTILMVILMVLIFCEGAFALTCNEIGGTTFCNGNDGNSFTCNTIGGTTFCN